MKQKITTILILLSLYFTPDILKAQTSLDDSLRNINLMYFVNKPIDSLLAKLPQSYNSIKTGPGGKSMFEGASVKIIFNQPFFLITIYSKTFNYINRFNPQNLSLIDQAWPLFLLRKELIAEVEIMGPTGAIINDTSGL
jgi:hypothetical protein